jgi:hypothetical protein
VPTRPIEFPVHVNAAVRGYNHDDATRHSILSMSGIGDDASAAKDAVNLMHNRG